MGCLQGMYAGTVHISAIKQARKIFNSKNEERARELAHANNQSDITYLELLEVRRLLALHFTELTHTSWTKRAESIFEQGDKNGKLLAILLAEQRMQTYLPCIKGGQGILLMDPTDILNTFCRILQGTICSYPCFQCARIGDTVVFLRYPCTVRIG